MADSELLQEYVQSGSEDAFAEVVRNHLDLVYSTALRALNGDQHLAKDISQSVFIDLARKASSLCLRTTLTGWLYTSTCFAAAKIVRSERRRQLREGVVHAVREQIGETNEPDWEQIRPLLDVVMLELKASDREALLLRFFERGSLEEVGTKLGLSQNAARMRVERALERLRERFTRRGVTSSGGALGLMLANQAVAAAPIGLAATISTTTTAAAAATSYSLLNLLGMSNIKALCIGAALAATVTTPILVQQRTNAALRAEMETLRRQLAEALPAQQRSAVAERAEIEQLRRENADLLRLRNEITALRQTVASMNNNPRQMEKMKGAVRPTNEAEEAKVLLAKAPEIPMVPAAKWSNVGFATPADALQTLNWAVAHQDTNAFSQALIWDAQARARAEALFAMAPESVRQRFGSVDAVIYDWWLNNATPISAARVLSQVDEGANESALVEQHIYTDGRVRENTVQFQRDETGAWRQVLPQEMMPKLSVVLNNLENLPTTTTAGTK